MVPASIKTKEPLAAEQERALQEQEHRLSFAGARSQKPAPPPGPPGALGPGEPQNRCSAAGRRCGPKLCINAQKRLVGSRDGGYQSSASELNQRLPYPV